MNFWTRVRLPSNPSGHLDVKHGDLTSYTWQIKFDGMYPRTIVIATFADISIN